MQVQETIFFNIYLNVFVSFYSYLFLYYTSYIITQMIGTKVQVMNKIQSLPICQFNHNYNSLTFIRTIRL